MLEPFLSPPRTPIYRKRGTLGALAAHTGELSLSHEVMSSPRRVGFLTMKLCDGPGEPDAGLGELGPRKCKEKTFFPSFLGIFCFPDRNTEWFIALHCN
ncbi:hypothetical protein HKD37_18G051096 [Glycine soja]